MVKETRFSLGEGTGAFEILIPTLGKVILH